MSVPPVWPSTSTPVVRPSVIRRGRANSVSVIEAIAAFEDRLGRRLTVEYVEETRVGDHVRYISDLRRLRADYLSWSKPPSSDPFWCSDARMSNVSVTCAGVSVGYAHDRRGEGDRDVGLDRDMPRPAHAGSGEQAEADPADLRNRDDAATWRWLPDSRLGTVVVERVMGPRGGVVAAVAA